LSANKVPVSGSIDDMNTCNLLLSLRVFLCTGITLLLTACASGPAAEPPAVIHANAHSGGSVVAFSQSGELLASGGWEGTVRLWQMPAGGQVRHWRDHADSVNGIAFLDGDRQLVTGGFDGKLVRRDVAGQVQQVITTPAPVTHLVADPGKDRVLTGHSDGAVRLWRLGDFSLLQERVLHRGTVKAVAIDPHAARYASGGADGRVFVWEEGGAVAELEAPPADPWTLAFAPDGQWLSGGSWFRLFRWQLQDGALTTLPTQHHGIIKSIEYISDNELATISRQTDSSVYFLDPASGATLRRFQRHALCGGDISISVDGRYLATTSDDASVRIWVLGNETKK
jgi:WD40 repeat protein